MHESITQGLKESADLFASLCADTDFARQISTIAGQIEQRLAEGGTVFFCGNGGSASDAQHLAAELQGRFQAERKGLAGIDLTANACTLTAIGNDYGFENIFSRPLEALGRPGDFLLGLSTSGNSLNVRAAFETAKDLGIVRVAITGKSGGLMGTDCDFLIAIPSGTTPRIQEATILAGHLLCGEIERLAIARCKA